jgi:hypothetical protein
MAIAYHNMGVELEYLKRYEECVSAYEVIYVLSFRKATNLLKSTWEREMGW